MSYTPGPWVVVRTGDPRHIEVRELAGQGYIVAGALGGGRLDAEIGANAHLIAAAPEMLNALRAALPHLPVREEIYARVRLAIAKAEGR
jgi:hypothetical protein